MACIIFQGYTSHLMMSQAAWGEKELTGPGVAFVLHLHISHWLASYLSRNYNFKQTSSHVGSSGPSLSSLCLPASESSRRGWSSQVGDVVKCKHEVTGQSGKTEFVHGPVVRVTGVWRRFSRDLT